MLVGLGGFFGAIARYAVSSWIIGLTGRGFPWGTLVINVVGCALIGFGVGWAGRHFEFSEDLRALLLVGVLGAFTTFSAFGIETVQLIRAEQWGQAAAYVGLSVSVGILAVIGGLGLGRWT